MNSTQNGPAKLNFSVSGQGQPLVLLHGIGMSSSAWAPIVPILSKSFQVYAVDLPGFGRSPALEARLPSVDNLTVALKSFLDAAGLSEPVDLVGNSLGGQVALCAARDGFARSVTALSPAGLWRGKESPLRTRVLLKMTRSASRLLPGISQALLGKSWGRKLAMGLTVSPHADLIPAEVAQTMAAEFVSSAVFDSTLASNVRFEGGDQIAVPVTVAFGKKDWLLARDCQNKNSLPPHVNWVFPEHWGHVPMWDDPEGVAELILQTAQ